VNSRFGSGHLSFSLLPRIYTLHTEEYPAFMVAHLISGWEIVLILAAVLIVFGVEKAPDIRRGFRKGFKEFWREWKDFTWMDRNAHDAGRSMGGIFGKRATEALTPENQVAELYEPAAFEKQPEHHRRQNLFACLSKWLCKCTVRVVHFMGSLILRISYRRSAQPPKKRNARGSKGAEVGLPLSLIL
jgi:Sec-independent protein translocase protein TatA